MAGIRDEIVDSVMVKKNNCMLSFGFGSLNLRHNGSVEFKSSHSGAQKLAEEQEQDKIPISAEFDNVSSASKKPSVANQTRQNNKDT